MSRWDEKVIKDDFNKAAANKKEEPGKPQDPELKPRPPKDPAPGLGGSGTTAWDRHHDQASDPSVKKSSPDKDNPNPTKEFNKNAKNR